MRLSSLLLASALSSVAAFVPSQSAHPSSSSSSLLLAHARQPLITGNWKLNPQTRDEAVALAQGILETMPAASADAPDVGLFVPYPFLEAVQEVVGDRIAVGAEMITPEDSGAFTGAISCPMLRSIGVTWALAGHSERRALFGETDADINAQCRKLVLDHDMHVVLCLGETLDEFDQNLVADVCEVQLKKGLAGIPAAAVADRVVLAYEPVWAIGTGRVATPEIAQGVHSVLRQILANMYGSETADAVRILYGGSVAPESVDGLLAQPDIDGALVGGASLEAAKFGRIINFEPAVVAA